MLSSQKIENNSGQEETFGSDVYVYGIECADGFTSAYVSPNSSNAAIKYILLFVCQATLNKLV